MKKVKALRDTAAELDRFDRCALVACHSFNWRRGNKDTVLIPQWAHHTSERYFIDH